MLIRLIRWFRGYVRFEITGRFIERFINLSIMQGRMLFDTEPSKGRVMASLLISDYKEIRPLAHRVKVKLKIRERHGLPFLISRYRSRKGLATGAALYIVIVLIMQCFMWTVDINGVDSLNEPYIRHLLYENGVYPGAIKFNINFHAVERDIMKKIEKIGWMSINLRGTKVEVELEEKSDIPSVVPADTPCNIKAKYDGIILQMNVKEGSTNLKAGSAVMQGQLVVSDVTKNANEQINLVHADAQIIAATEHTYSTSINISGVYNKSADIAKRPSFLFLGAKIPYVFSSVKDPYTSRGVTEKRCLNSTKLQVGRLTE